jgi:hypothetical protein
MHEQSRAVGDRRLERAIVLVLLSGDREPLGGDGESRWSRAQLAAELGTEAQALQEALERLSQAGVVCLTGAEVWASRAARRMDELGLISI